MLDVIRDPLWQFVGAVIGLVAIGIALWLHPRKSLSYEVISSNLVRIDVDERLKKKTKVLYDGKRVENVSTLLIKITNTGNRPILTTDYIEPITIWLSGKALILDAGMETHPATLNAEVGFDDQNIVFDPVMLNSGDSIKIAALIKNYSQWGMDGRIVGVKDFTELGASRLFSNTSTRFRKITDIAMVAAPIFIGVLLLFYLQYMSWGDLAILVEMALILCTITALRLIIREPLLREKLAIKRDKRLLSSERGNTSN